MQSLTKTASGCRPSQLLGPWLMEAEAYEDLYVRAMAIIAAGQLEVVAKQSAEQAAAEANNPGYVVDNGVACFSVNGVMTRSPTSLQSALGGTATMLLQRAMGRASMDPNVTGAFFDINSPGGTVEGIIDTSAAMNRMRGKMPLRCHISGTGASAAYWLALGGDTITADPMSVVGSVGVLVKMRDTSELMKRAGVKDIYIASGDRKMAGSPGTVVTDEHIAEAQAVVDEMNQSFQAAVTNRRPNISDEHRKDIARAGVYGARSALNMKMVDAIMSTEDAFQQFSSRIPFGDGRTLPG